MSLYNMVFISSTRTIMLNSELQDIFGTANNPCQLALAAAGGTLGLRAKALFGG